MSTGLKKWQHYALNILFILVLAGIVYWVVVKDNSVDILSLIKKADFFWIGVAILCLLLMRCCTAYIYKCLCHFTHPHYRLVDGFVNSFSGFFFSAITPSYTGGQFAQAYVFGKQGIPISVAASVLWVDFVIAQSTLVTSVLLFLLLRFNYFYYNYSQFFIFVIIGFFMNAAIIVVLFMLVRFPRFYKWVMNTGVEIVGKLKLTKDKEVLREKINRTVDRFQNELSIFASHKKLLALLFSIDFVKNLLYYIVPYFVALGLRLAVPANQIIHIMALASFVNVINALIPLPGSSGGTEVTFVLMFSTIFGNIQATSIMLVWRFITYYLMMIIGGIMFVIVKVSPSKTITESEKKE